MTTNSVPAVLDVTEDVVIWTAPWPYDANRIVVQWTDPGDAMPWGVMEYKLTQWQKSGSAGVVMVPREQSMTQWTAGILDAESIQVATDPDWVESVTTQGMAANG